MISVTSFLRSSKPSLQLILVVPFVLQITVAVGLTGWISLRNGQKAVNELARQLHHKAADQINDELINYLEQAMLVNRININAIATGALNLDQLSSLEPYLTQQLKEFQSLNSITISTEKPNYIGLGYDDIDASSRYFSVWNPTLGGTFDWQINAKGQRIFLGTDPSYDHRHRPWYQAAIRSDRPIWTAIDLSITPQNLILSANQPFYDAQGNILGVVSTDLGLGQISQFLHSLQISPTGQAFIIEQNGLLVATSADELPYRIPAQQSDLERIQASESKHPLIRQTITFLQTQYPNFSQVQQLQQLDFKIAGQKIFVSVTPFQDPRGIDWIIVTAVPESDFMATINANTRTTILLCLAALASAILVGIILAQRLVKPLLNVVHKAEALSQGFWDADLPEPYSKELTLLTQAFSRMARQLQASFTTLQYSAYHDELTGLLNQATFRLKLQQMIQKQVRSTDTPDLKQSIFSVLFLDLDDFKLVNDSLGHLVGDQLLRTVALALREKLRSTDILARFGGDEFVVLVSPIQDLSESTQIANQLLQCFHHPFQVGNNTLFLNVSIGIAHYDQAIDQAETLIRNADIALYRAKVNPKASYEVFDNNMHLQTLERLQMETDLRYAIEREELVLHYQPIVNLKSFKISGFEALIRWQHPTQGLVPPSTFIPIAEETGLIVELGYWILQQATQQMKQWQQNFDHCHAMTMSVNVSSKQLIQANFLEYVNNSLSESGLLPHCLKLEITETSLLKYHETLLQKLNYIKALGVQISIDDFGIGYSSLSYLNQFPIDTLKIDRFFVQCLGTADRSSEIAEVICLLAQKLELTTVAEGIETEIQLEQICQIGCEYAQGYYFFPPLTPIEVEQQLVKDS